MMRIADLTIDEFQALLKTIMRELVEEIVDEKLGELIDPDEGLELRPEVQQSLHAYLASDQDGDDADEVFASLGLE
jgi:hypothetical protein